MGNKHLIMIQLFTFICLYLKAKWVKSHSIYLNSKVQRSLLYSQEQPSSLVSQTRLFLRYCTNSKKCS